MNPRRRAKKRKPRPKLNGDVRVLVVDDDPEIRDILRERLFIEGFKVTTADSGEEALAKFIVHQGTPEAFDVVTLDIRMRDLSGRQVLSLLRKIDHRVCILMISGLDDLSQAVQSLSQGADDYLSKPIKIWDIRDRLTTAMGRRASLVDRQARRQDRIMAGQGTDGQGKGGQGKGGQGKGGQGTGGQGTGGENWATAYVDEATGTGQPSHTHRTGVEWGTALSPSEINASDKAPHNPMDDDGPRIVAPNDEFLEPASPLEGIAGPGDPADQGSELTPRDILERETGSGDGSGQHGSGRIQASDSWAGNRGGVTAEDPDGPRAFAREAEPIQGGRRGSLLGLDPSMNPLDRALELTQRIERSWEGCEGHGERVARLLEKLGASLATNLGLSSCDLDGLCLAARVHSLGIQVRREEDSRQWEPGHWKQDHWPTDNPEARPSNHESSHPIPGREREDAGLVARFLCALLEEEEKQASAQATDSAPLRPHTVPMSIGQALLARLGRRQAEEQELDPGLRDLLHGHMEDLRAQDTESSPAGNEGHAASASSPLVAIPGQPALLNLPEAHLDKLLALYEVADGWIHLTCEGMGGLSPEEAFPELCAALTNRLPAHPTSMALAYLRAQI